MVRGFFVNDGVENLLETIGISVVPGAEKIWDAYLVDFLGLTTSHYGCRRSGITAAHRTEMSTCLPCEIPRAPSMSGLIPASTLEAQEIHSLVLTMTSNGEKPPLKLLALGRCVNEYSLGDGITN